MSVRLSVNLNAVAFLRNRRDLPWPNLCDCARIAIQAGASGLTVHPRPDERHIRYQDVYDLHHLLLNEFPQAELNIEGFPDKKFLGLVKDIVPAQVTLVPDAPTQKTSDHGWDFLKQGDFLKSIVADLRARQSRVSLFCDPDAESLDIVQQLEPDRIEIFTGPYGATYQDQIQQAIELQKIKETAEQAQSLGLAINAGHDLTRANIPILLKHVPFISEMSIGHALIADSLQFGLAETVRKFLQVM